MFKTQQESKTLENYRSPDELKQQIYQQQGDKLAQKLKFQEAIMSYTTAIECQESAQLYVSRSKCHIRLGNIKQAIDDANMALRVGGEMNSQEVARYSFQVAEANFAAGEFEIALQYYYKAYYSRTDYQLYRLSVQKAEKAILNALDQKIVLKDIDNGEDVNPTLDKMIQTLSCAEGESGTGGAAIRCLCGCVGCNPHMCRDLYSVPGEHCGCRCSACVRHLAYSHGMVTDPVTGQLVAVALLANTAAENSSSTNVAAPSQQTAQGAFADRRRQNLRQKSAIQRDKELLEDLIKDRTLQKTCASLQTTLQRGNTFLQTRETFWENQGLDVHTGGRKHVNQGAKQAPVPPQRKAARRPGSPPPEQQGAEEAQIDAIVRDMQECKRLLDGGDFGGASARIEAIRGRLEQLEQHDTRHGALLGKVRSDLEVMAGCCEFDCQNFRRAAELFQASLAHSAADRLLQIRAIRNTGKAQLMVCDYQAAAGTFEGLIAHYKQAYNSRLVYCSDLYLYTLSLSEWDFDAHVQQITAQTDECLSILCGAPSSALSVERTQLVIRTKEQNKFNNIAPSFFQVDHLTAEALLYDVLIMQAKIYGVQQAAQAVTCYKIIYRMGSEQNDSYSVRGALASLKTLYDAVGDESGAQWVAAERHKWQI